MMAGTRPTRYIELIDDIRNHVFQWATDADWGRLPPKVNVALTTLMNELKIAEAVGRAGERDDSDESITAEKRRFIACFKKKYLERITFEFTDPITPVNQCNIARVINELKAEGGTYIEFIEWFFDDYCALEENKKFMPPQINYMCSNYVVKKYLYQMKDKLRMRKENISKESTRTMLLDIALPLQKRISCSGFAQKIIDYDNGVIAASKFFDLMKAFARKYDDADGIAACERLDEKVKELKRTGM